MTMIMHKRNALAVAVLVASAGVLAAPLARAAKLAVQGSSITIDTQGANINAVEVHATFDPRRFTITGTSDGGSVVEAWVEAPAFSNASGTLDFAGIIPGGITTAHGRLLTVYVKPAQPSGQGTLSFMSVSAQALLDDGKGTPAPLSVVQGALTAASPPATALATASGTGTATGTGTAASGTADTGAPDPFVPAIGSDPALYGGRYFVAFGTTDQRSGIDHYDVLEVPAGTDPNAAAGSWREATSPYALADQSLGSDIYVRAVNRAGNFRTAEIPAAVASKSLKGGRTAGVTPLLVALSVILIGTVAVLAWKRKRNIS